MYCGFKNKTQQNEFVFELINLTIHEIIVKIHLLTGQLDVLHSGRFDWTHMSASVSPALMSASR